MENRNRLGKIICRVLAAGLACCVFTLAIGSQRDGRQEGLGRLFWRHVQKAAISVWCPALSYAGETKTDGPWEKIARLFPVLYLYGQEEEIVLLSESSSTYEEIIRAEGQDEKADTLPPEALDMPESSAGRMVVDQEQEKLLAQENAAAAEKKETELQPGAGKEGQPGTELPDISANGLFPATDKAVERGKAEKYDWSYYRKFDALLKEFYAVDASTVVDENQLNLETLLGKDMSIQKRSDDKPQILIYHTHSQEGFINSAEGDASTTIMGVGEVLAQILREEYGYNVMHHLGQYDVEDRDYAYNNSLPAMEQLLKENPTIQVVIDLHRDEMPEDIRLVTEIDGRPTARFMFFNGLSRTRKHGDIEYLPNQNSADNLAFSFQMQVLCNEYYPGLARRIYLKGYRYNMHLMPRYLLVEMGAQNNTYEECYNACLPLARILDMELSGADFG